MKNVWQKLDIAAALLAIGVGSVFLLEIENPGLFARWGLISFMQAEDYRAAEGVADLARDEGRLRLRASESSVWRDFELKKAPVRQGDAIYTSSQSEATLTMKQGGLTAKIGADSLVVVKRLSSKESATSPLKVQLEIKRGKVTLEIPASKAQQGPLSVEVAGKVYEIQAPEVKPSAQPPTTVELKLVDVVDQRGKKAEPQLQISAASQAVQVKIKPVESRPTESPAKSESVVQLSAGKVLVESLDVKQVVSLKADPIVASMEREKLELPLQKPVEPQRQIAAVQQTTVQVPEFKQEITKRIELPQEPTEKRAFQLGFSLQLLMGQRGVTDQSSSLGADFALEASPGFELLGEFPVSPLWSVYPEVRASLTRVRQPTGSVQLSANTEVLGDFLAGVGLGGKSPWRLRLSAGLARRMSFSELSTNLIGVGTIHVPVVQAHAQFQLNRAFDLGLKTRGLVSSDVGYEQEVLVRYYPHQRPQASEQPDHRRFFWAAGCEIGRYSQPNTQTNTLDFLIRWGLD